MMELKTQKKFALVLLSGGIDSSACIEYYLSLGFLVEALFVNYGQASAKQEENAANLICKYFKIPLHIIDCLGFINFSGGFISGRNALLLQIALTYCAHRSSIVAIGIHSGTSYIDCSKEFICKEQEIFDLYTNGQIQIDAPFIQWSKRDILEYSEKKEIPLDLTYSCELGRNQPCGCCLSCKDVGAYVST